MLDMVREGTNRGTDKTYEHRVPDDEAQAHANILNIYIHKMYEHCVPDIKAQAVPRLVLPRLAHHVAHQDKRIRRGVGVRAGGSQGRRELQAAADNELVTERCAIRRH